MSEIFFMFGTSVIIQSNNGRESIIELINNPESDFPGEFFYNISFSVIRSVN